MTPKEKDKIIDDIVRFYNKKTGMHYKCGNKVNRDAIEIALEKCNYSKASLLVYIEDNYNKSYDLISCISSFEPKTKFVEFEEIEQKPKTNNVNDAMNLLSQAVVDMIAKTQSEELEKKVLGNLQDTVRDFVKEEYGVINRKVQVTVDDRPPIEMNEVTHKKFDEVLKFVANKEPVFLTGRAGTGKNVLCKQVAKALGLDFYFSNAVTQEYKITGFTDANGTYHETQFYKAFKNGGLFMLDEMDASIPEVLVILNSAIANGYFDFPAPIGYVEANENFRVVGAGNTFGLGADYEYVGRNQLDMASLDRFALVEIDYDRNIEMNVAMNNSELVDFAEAFRESARNAGVKCVVSYRAIGRIAKMEKLLGVNETLKACLVKSLEKDDLNLINNGINNYSVYKDALSDILREMR